MLGKCKSCRQESVVVDVMRSFCEDCRFSRGILDLDDGKPPIRMQVELVPDEMGVCQVYFLRNAAGYINIGVTDNLKRRMKEYYAHAGPGGVELLGTLFGTPAAETGIHRMFSKFLVERGLGVGREWFYPDPSILEYIQKNCELTDNCRTDKIKDDEPPQPAPWGDPP